MTETLSISYKMRLFTLSELSAASGKSMQVLSNMLHRWQRQGLAMQIRRNLYCMVDPVSGQPTVNKFEIGSHLSDSAYISHHTALEFHGIAHQPFNEVMVMSCTRIKPFSFDDTDYHFCQDKIGRLGLITPKGSPLVRVTDMERTLIDCIDRIDRAGGIEELLHCMESVALLDEKRLLVYLNAYAKSFLYQKTGYLMERIKDRARISSDFIETCRKMGKNHVKWLTNSDESDTFIKEWQLYVPQVIIENEEYELI